MPPLVSIVVPCYNEEASIGQLLEALLAQTHPPEDMEVVIADGISEDRTRDVIHRFAENHPQLVLRVVDNLRRTIPSGLNLAIQAARGEFIVRLDAHSIPIPDYVERCVQAIQQGKGDNVGGIWKIRPGGKGRIPQGIAAAAGHWLGAGDAQYRLGGPARAVDTVPFGSFRRQLIGRIGPFDETLLTNEDYEFNVRIRQAGGVVWLDPEIKSIYIARARLSELAKQYWRYGFWKCRMLLRHPGTLRWRQAAPAGLVLSVVLLAALSATSRAAQVLLGTELGVYVLALLAGSLQIALRQHALFLAPAAFLAFSTMHFSWGFGFWWGLVSNMVGNRG